METSSLLMASVLAALSFALGMLCHVLISRRLGKKGMDTEDFLQSVLQSVDNIVNYYEPIYDAAGKISDFKIVYANECNREYLGLDPAEITGRPISEVFPFLFLNGEFEGLVDCFAHRKKVVLHRQVKVGGERMWFKSIVKPLSGGVSVTARNTTPEKSAEEKLRAMNEELKARNRELSDTGYFLNEVIKATPAIITYLEPVGDRSGGTTDFEIVFASEAAENLANGAAGEILGGNLSEMFPDLMETRVFGLLSRCMQTGGRQSVEVEIRKGEEGTSSYTATASRTGSGITLTLDRTMMDRTH